MIRTRTRGSQDSISSGYKVTDCYFDGRRIVSGGTTYLSPLLYESMTDVIGARQAQNKVSHYVKRRSEDNVVQLTGLINTAVPVKDTYYVEVAGVIPLSSHLQVIMAPLGQLSGIRALAVANLPAYSPELLNSFVSIVELRDIVNSSLAHFAKASSRFLRGNFSYVRKQLSELNALRKLNKLNQVSYKGNGLPVKYQKREILLNECVRLYGVLKRADSAASFEAAQSAFLRAVQGLSGLNMEYKYAWAPMFADMQAWDKSILRMSKIGLSLQKGYRVYGRAQDVRSSSGSISANWLNQNTYSGRLGLFTGSYAITTKTVAIASIVRKLRPGVSYYDLDVWQRASIRMEIMGVQPSLSKTWQLMPLSFISDWFWSVTKLLKSLETVKSPIGSQFVSELPLYSLKTVTTIKGSGSFARDANSTLLTASASLKTYDRNPDNLQDNPFLYIPPVTLPTNAGKWWSMVQIAITGKIQ